jgi:hypothetical protein
MSTQAKRHTALLVALALLLAPEALLAQDAADEPPADPAAEAEPDDEAPGPDEGEPTAEEPTEDGETTAEESAPAEEPAEEPPAEEAAAAEESVAGEEDAADEEPEIDPFVPGMGVPEEDTVPYDDQLEEEEDQHVDDGKPFAKGDMELGVGIVAGGGGYLGSSTFVLGAGGAFAYYVVNRLAPGIQLQYVHVFSDYEFPDDFRVLPFLKFVIIRSTRFAPYLVLAGGRDFEWGGTDDPAKGYPAVSSWLLGGGAGAHIGLGARASMNIQLLALYHWFDEKVALAGKEGLHDGALEFPILSLSIAFFF